MDKQLRIILTYQDQASAGLARTVGTISGAVGGMQSGIGKAFTGITGIVSGTVGRVKGYITEMADHMRWASLFIGAMVAGIGTAFVNMAAGLEQTRIGFETLLKDDAKVRDALGFIQKWALETPFSVTEATDSFKRFLAVTGDLQLTKKYLQNLGDAVVATGGNINEFNFAARAMTQIQAMSKVRAQEMYQLVNANIPAFDILARAIQNGKLKVEGLNTVTAIAGSAGGPTKKMTTAYEKANETFGILVKRSEAAEMRLKSLSDAGKQNTASFKSAEASVMSAHLALDKAKGSISDYTNATKTSSKAVDVHKMSLNEIKGQLQDIGDLNISGAEAAKIFSEYFEQAYGGAAKKSTTTLRGAIGVLKDQIVFTSAALLGYNQITGETYGIYARLKDVIGAISKFLSGHQQAFQKLGKALQSNTALWGLLGVALGIVIGFLAGILWPVIQMGIIFGILGAVIGTIIEKFGLFNDVGKKLDWIKGKFAPMIDFMHTKFERLGQITDDIREKLAAKLFPDNFAQANASWANLLSLLLKPKLERLGQIIQDWKNRFIFKTSEPPIPATWTMIFDKVAQKVKEAAVKIGKIIIDLANFIETHIEPIKGILLGLGVAITLTLIPPFIAWAIAATAAGIATVVAAATALIALAPLLIFIAVITAVVALLYLAWTNNWGGIQDKTRAVVDWFNGTAKPILETAFEIIKKAVKILFELWKKLVDKVWEALKKLIDFISDTFVPIFEEKMNSIKGIIEKMTPAWVKEIGTISNAFQKVADTIGNVLGKVDELSRKATGKGVASMILKAIPGIGMFFQHGGIVPGQVGQAVPIMAHGGERIIPRGSNTQAPSGGGGGVTINMTGPVSMDSPQRVKELASEIIKIMGRQNELSKYGVGFSFV